MIMTKSTPTAKRNVLITDILGLFIVFYLSIVHEIVCVKPFHHTDNFLGSNVFMMNRFTRFLLPLDK